VLLISLDTTRADHLGAYGNTEVKTPALDALAAEGTVFTACMAPAATTLASHTSLLTGTYPLSHGVRRNGYFVGQDNVLLAERLRDAGFYCAAVLGSSALTAKSELNQGFDHFDDDFSLEVESGGRDQDQRTSAEVSQAVLDHVDSVLGRQGTEEEFPDQMFLLAHYFDPHAPYAPSPSLAQRYGASLGVGDFDDIESAVVAQQRRVLGEGADDLGQQAVIQRGLSEALVRNAPGVATRTGRDLAKLYAGEVTATDDAIGTLLAGLASRGILDNTLVIVTADHGETFWEHGNFWNHGLWVSQTDVHVPLIMRFPGGRGAGRRVDAPVSGVDVMPTLLAALGLDPAAAAETPARGRSLLPAIDGRPLVDRAVFSEATQPGPSLEKGTADGPLPWGNARKPQAVRLGDWKLVDAPYLGIQQLFHLGQDPGERHDYLAAGALAPDARAAFDDLKLALQRWRAAAAPKASTYDDSQTDVLRSMGYSEAGER
jgi:arylsulfatase